MSTEYWLSRRIPRLDISCRVGNADLETVTQGKVVATYLRRLCE